ASQESGIEREKDIEPEPQPEQQRPAIIETYESRYRRERKEAEDRQWAEQVKRDRERYMKYKRHAILELNHPPEKVIPFAQWQRFAERTKEQLLERVEQEKKK